MAEDGIAARARALAAELASGGFARLRVREGDVEIELRRRPHATAHAHADGQATIEAPSSRRRPDVIASDVVGVVHLLRPPVSEGQELEGDRELAYVETLGIRNSVRSRGGGRIGAVLVTDGEPVEFGQPLFTIDR
ncbi:MAG: hypothetical protein JOZ24_09005 [Candidatus Eremiobacteraeota bacterium]|nr:hypothetical protein [Candidatus Eremiobacteraeota bacterium]